MSPRKTAQELMDALEADPEWVARRDERERALQASEQELAADEAGLVGEIRNLGYEIESVWDLVNNTPHPCLERRFVGSYENTLPVLITHLKVPHHPRIREGIIRALTVRGGGKELEAALLEELHAEADQNMRWVLGNALSVAMPYHRRRKHPEIKAALDRRE